MMQPEADAAEQVVGNLAGIDGRIAIFFVFAPGPQVGRVQHLGPRFPDQLEDMQKKKPSEKKRDRRRFDGVVCGVVNGHAGASGCRGAVVGNLTTSMAESPSSSCSRRSSNWSRTTSWARV